MKLRQALFEPSDTDADDQTPPPDRNKLLFTTLKELEKILKGRLIQTVEYTCRLLDAENVNNPLPLIFDADDRLTTPDACTQEAVDETTKFTLDKATLLREETFTPETATAPLKNIGPETTT